MQGRAWNSLSPMEFPEFWEGHWILQTESAKALCIPCRRLREEKKKECGCSASSEGSVRRTENEGTVFSNFSPSPESSTRRRLRQNLGCGGVQKRAGVPPCARKHRKRPAPKGTLSYNDLNRQFLNTFLNEKWSLHPIYNKRPPNATPCAAGHFVLKSYLLGAGFADKVQPAPKLAQPSLRAPAPARPSSPAKPPAPCWTAKLRGSPSAQPREDRA